MLSSARAVCTPIPRKENAMPTLKPKSALAEQAKPLTGEEARMALRHTVRGKPFCCYQPGGAPGTGSLG